MLRGVNGEPRSSGPQHEVCVAAWGPAFGAPEAPFFLGEQFLDQGEDVPYDGRSKVVLHTESDTPVSDIIDEAARRFGVESPNERKVSDLVHWVAFFRAGDEGGMPYDYDRWHAAIRTVDSSRQPSWALRWSVITIGELIATHDAGLLDGDPLRPYFWPVIPQGDLLDLFQALWQLWSHWEDAVVPHIDAAAVTLGPIAVAAEFARRVRAAKRAASEHHESLSRALERPQEFLSYLDSAPRTTAEIAKRTGLPEPATAKVLAGIGYVFGADGRWRSGADAPAALLRKGLLEIRQQGRGPTVEEAAETVRAAFLTEESKRETGAGE